MKGDQILEFNGNSLIDSTYEEVRVLQNLSGDYVQLVVHHNNIRQITCLINYLHMCTSFNQSLLFQELETSLV